MENNKLDKKEKIGFCFRYNPNNKKIILKNFIYLNSFLFLILILSPFVFAIPNSLTLQGKLTNTAGASISGTNNFTFAIYDNITSGSRLWELANYNVTTDANGVYDVILNGINLSFADQYYLGITIAADNESKPRINLTSAPYSFRANTSEALNPNASYFVRNLSVSGHATIGNGSSLIEISTQNFNFSSTAGNLNINGTVTAKSFVGDGSQLSGVIAVGSQQIFNSSGTNVYLNDSTANLGLGLSNPSDRLVVIGSVRVSGSLNASSINTTGSAYFATSSGNVGIGTTAPAQKLVVVGNANISQNLTVNNSVLFVDGTSGNVGIGTTSPRYLLQVAANVTNAVNLSNTLYINGSSGNVGIGTAGPKSLLSLALNGEPTIQIDSASDNEALNPRIITKRALGTLASPTTVTLDNILLEIAAQGWNGGSFANAASLQAEVDGTPDTFVPGRWVFYTTTGTSTLQERMRISNTGNVGIGAARTPVALLDVSATDTNTAFASNSNAIVRFTNLDTTNNNWQDLRFTTLDGDSGVTTGSIIASQFTSHTVGAVTSDLAFGNRNGATISEQVRIKNTGNVGINTTMPNATLHVVGNMIIQAPYSTNVSTPKILNITNSTGKTLCSIDAAGSLVCTGTKSASVDTSFDERKLYAVESPDVRHIDEGRAKLKNGYAKVSIDPIFKETIENEYNVYVTPEGKTKALYVAEKTKDYFIVKDTAPTNAVFSYIISAYRRGYTSKRFDSGSEIEIIVEIDAENELTGVEIKGETSSVVPLPQLIDNNLINETIKATSVGDNTDKNISSRNAGIEKNNLTDENEKMTIKDTTYKYISNNKFTVNSIDEEEIIKEIEQKTKLDKDMIKRSIKFRKKEPIKAAVEEDIADTEAVIQQAPQIDYIKKVNGSVIIRLG